MRQYKTLKDCLDALERGMVVDEADNRVPRRTMDMLWERRDSYRIACMDRGVWMMCTRGHNHPARVPPSPNGMILVGHYRYQNGKEIRWIDRN